MGKVILRSWREASELVPLGRLQKGGRSEKGVTSWECIIQG